MYVAMRGYFPVCVSMWLCVYKVVCVWDGVSMRVHAFGSVYVSD